MFLYKLENFKEGKLDGKSQEFGEDGKVSSEKNYREGVEISLPPSSASGLDIRAHANTLNIESCVDSWIAAHHKEIGEDATITADQLNEWKNWCAQGKIPKAQH
ncbi:hypothetical protein SAMN04515617_1414 [Collimonas sp. OK242]|uniref:hypothetical protein n=1 Tax=Collimonas sp. OK242 TaxID=1798195 RepID=UPI000899CFB1|nr:hypothetical protein [Collimonas sp. OK242]SDY98216.1 hypothetical protein SAMN04515617_1414 [Collimonas sp. OK242]